MHKLTLSTIAFVASLAAQMAYAQNVTFEGRIEANAVAATHADSWQSKGIGLSRTEHNSLNLQQSFVKAKVAFNKDWRFTAVLNAYTDGEKHLGLTQAFARYKPIVPNTIKFSARLGFFYPSMSIENTANGWLSPYSYTQSAINSWIGEELRVLGAEASWSLNGRKQRSPWSWRVNLAAYKGNDPLGSLLTWRGFAMHNRQSLHHSRVQFANIPSVINSTTFESPTWLAPFSEIDGKIGVYAGMHISYLRQTNLRYYFYDNRANPLAVNKQRLYAWRTKFHSLALQHQLSSAWRFMAQYMDGDTLMGDNQVQADYLAWYAAISHTAGKHRFTARYDNYKVYENDSLPEDPNNSNGSGLTLNWQWQFSKRIEWGIEWHQHKSTVSNRALLNAPVYLRQSQLLFVSAYTF